MGGDRRSKFKSRPGRGAPARVPPSEATGREMSFLRESKDRAARVVVHLVDGLEARGVIEYYDNDVIKLERPAGPSLLIRKADIRYLAEEPDPAT